MPCFKDFMNYGNLFIEFDVKFPLPGQLTSDHKEMLQKVCLFKKSKLNIFLVIARKKQSSQSRTIAKL